MSWIRSHQKNGSFPTDVMIREKALFFASSCGNARARDIVTHAGWLETFKQQHNLIATGPSIKVFDSNESGFIVQTLTSTDLMLGPDGMRSNSSSVHSAPQAPSQWFSLPFTLTRPRRIAPGLVDRGFAERASPVTRTSLSFNYTLIHPL